MATEERPKLLGSCRFTLCVLCFLAVLHINLMRLNLSMGLVCMTGEMDHMVMDMDMQNESMMMSMLMSNETMEVRKEMKAEFDWDKTILANIIGAYFYGYILTPIVGGWVSDKFGAKKALFSGMLSLAIFSALIPEATRLHYGALLFCRTLQGLISGFLYPILYNVFGVWSSSAEKSTLMAITFAGAPVASIVTFPLSSLLCSTHLDGGWPMVFYVPAVTCFAWCLAFYYLTASTPSEHPRISKEEKYYLEYHASISAKVVKERLPVPWREMLTSGPVHALWITHLAGGWTVYLISINMPFFVKESFNLHNIILNGLLCGFPSVGPVVICLCGKFFDAVSNTNRWSTNALRKFFNTIGMLTPSLLLCLLPYIHGPVAQVLVLSTCLAFSQIPVVAGFFISHSDVAGPFSGLLFGITNTMGHVSGFINPLLIAALAPNGTRAEWQDVFYVAAGTGVVGSLVYLMFGSNDRQPWAVTKEVASEKEMEANNATTVEKGQNIV